MWHDAKYNFFNATVCQSINNIDKMRKSGEKYVKYAIECNDFLNFGNVGNHWSV